MSRVTVYGASDDLIEVEGDLREEFNAIDQDEPQYLAFSDGTVLSIQYTDEGLWRVNRRVAGSAVYSKAEATNPDGDYSDRVTLEGDNLTWAVYGKGLVVCRAERSRG